MTKIYLFNNSDGRTDWNVVYAMADTGEVLASHVCSHRCFMAGDLHDNRPERQKAWEEKYGEYETVIVPQGEAPPEDVLEKNRLLGELADQSEGNKASIEITMSDVQNDEVSDTTDDAQ